MHTSSEPSETWVLEWTISARNKKPVRRDWNAWGRQWGVGRWRLLLVVVNIVRCKMQLMPQINKFLIGFHRHISRRRRLFRRRDYWCWPIVWGWLFGVAQVSLFSPHIYLLSSSGLLSVVRRLLGSACGHLLIHFLLTAAVGWFFLHHTNKMILAVYWILSPNCLSIPVS